MALRAECPAAVVAVAAPAACRVSAARCLAWVCREVAVVLAVLKALKAPAVQAATAIVAPTCLAALVAWKARAMVRAPVA